MKKLFKQYCKNYNFKIKYQTDFYNGKKFRIKTVSEIRIMRIDWSINEISEELLNRFLTVESEIMKVV